MHDAVQTARAYGLAAEAVPALDAAAPDAPRTEELGDFRALLTDVWLPLTSALNQVNRSMGLPDVYPFVLAAPVIDKLELVARVLDDAAGR